jgi:hypothetical protein
MDKDVKYLKGETKYTLSRISLQAKLITVETRSGITLYSTELEFSYTEFLILQI